MLDIIILTNSHSVLSSKKLTIPWARGKSELYTDSVK